MRLYNFLSRKVEDFKPFEKSQGKPDGDIVGLYTCGPTVYNFVHIGNWRTFVFEDILKRALLFDGYKVKHIMNITDIDDKIIKKAGEEQIPINELTKEYTDAFFADLGRLNILKADEYPQATEHIDSMLKMIGKLVEHGLAYVKDGSVYFSISKFKDYGKLSGTNVKGVKAGARVDVDEYDKDNPQDFVLWKASTEDAKVRHEAFDSPWGVGRPGWHIECSAMSTQYLGDTFDIHTGGVDLLFPHHENEIAQSEGATGKKFVNIWMEGEHLLVNGEKMAKRLGNVFTLGNVTKKGFDPLALRYLFLTAHYRSKLNFTWESLEAAQSALYKIRESIANISEKSGISDDISEFTNAINDDLNMPRAMAFFHESLKNLNKSALLKMDEVFGLGFANIEKAELPDGAWALIDKREKLRGEKKFEEADQLRDQLAQIGVFVEDKEDGTTDYIIKPTG